MDETGFRKFCKEGKRVRKGLSESTVDAHLKLAREFEAFLRKGGGRKDFKSATKADARRFVKHLIDEKKNTEENLLGLLRFARFVDNREVELEVLISLDGALVFDKISEIVKEKVGPEVHARVFRGVARPELGSQPKDWHLITKRFMEQLEREVSKKDRRRIFLEGPHAAPVEYHAEERTKLLASKDVDDYLRRKHKESIELLEEHMRNGTLFFTQPIDEDVLRLVRGNQEILAGRREGDAIMETKMPFMAIEYLKEKDERMKRYYYCHCPWVREAIRTGVEVSPGFCLCSAGFEKRPFDAAFAQPLDAEVLSSVLAGDPVCRFAIKIPPEYVPKRPAKKPAKGKRKAKPGRRKKG